MNDAVITGPKHTRYTMMAKLDPQSKLRDVPMEDKPTKGRDYSKDSIAATIVCWRTGARPGEVEFLTILYENGGRGKTFRFPTETGEQALGEDKEAVSRACIYQEVIVSDCGWLPEIGPCVMENVRQSDSNRQPRPQTTEILGPPEWVEASELMDRMLSRGIQSHRDSLVAAVVWCAGQSRAVSDRYMRELREWGAAM